jgi:hypothetical protein
LDTPHIEQYPVVVSKNNNGRFDAKAIDFDNCEQSSENLHEVLELIADKIESISWDISATNDRIPAPSSFKQIRTNHSNQLIFFVNVVKRYGDNPKILYLYYPINEHLLSMLLKPYIFFSDPTKYNDPFEMPDVMDHEWTNKEKVSELRFQIPLAKECGEKWALEINDVDDFLVGAMLQKPEFIEHMLGRKKSALETVVKRYRAACFSRQFNNPLMWSHYTDKHEGIVIGYKLSSILQPDIRGSDIDYRKHKVKLRAGYFAGESLDAFSDSEYITRKLFTKHPRWSYEQEYRLLRLYDDEKPCSPKLEVPIESIKELYFGCKMSDEAKSNIAHIINGREISIFEMKMKDDGSLAHSDYLKK